MQMEGETLQTDKLYDATALAPLLASLRADGRCIVFTNGCFDVLHAGHVRYLQAARRAGDRLVVGVNSDASVRGIKGPKRPIVGQQDRVAVLGALSCVDFVVLFDEPDPGDLIRHLRPDVLVKGADWPEDQIVGAAFVKSNGGQVLRMPLVEGLSTTRIIETICDRYGRQNNAADND